MTVNSTSDRITYLGNGATTAWMFPFPGVAVADIIVYTLDASGNQSTIDPANYTVTLNAPVGANPTGTGGIVTYPLSGTPLALGTSITLVRTLAFQQLTSLANQGTSYPTVIEQEFDYVTMLTQQLNDLIGRQLTVAQTDPIPTAIPSVAQRAGHVLAFDSDGNPIVGDVTSPQVVTYATTVATIAALKALDTTFKIAMLTDVDRQGNFIWRLGDYSAQIAQDTGNGIFVKSDSAASTFGAWVREFDGQIYYSNWFGLPNDGTNQTTGLTTALAVMAGSGVNKVAHIMQVRPGTHFALDTLVFPQLGYMLYFPQDDTSGSTWFQRVTSEYILHAFNASVGPGGGIVNENRFQANYGPGFIINLTKNSAAQDAYLGAGQHRVPGPNQATRAYFVIEDEYVTTWQFTLEDYGNPTKSTFDGLSMLGQRRRITFTVDQSAGLIGGVGQLLTGLTSGGYCYFVSRTVNTVTVDWQYQKFQVGEQLFDGGGGPYPVISQITWAITSNQPQYFGVSCPNITWGMAAGDAITDFSFAGRVTLGPTVNFGQNVYETVVHPWLVLVKDWIAPTVGKQIGLAADNRPVVREGTTLGTTNYGLVGACNALCAFTNAAGVSAGAYNIASVTRSGVGVYDVVFITNVPNALYSIQATNRNNNDRACATSIGVGGFTITNYDFVTNVPKDLTDLVYVAAFGGF